MRAYDASGALVRTIGRELPPQRVTCADFEECVSLSPAVCSEHEPQ